MPSRACGAGFPPIRLESSGGSGNDGPLDAIDPSHRERNRPVTSRSFLSSLALSFVLFAPSTFAADASVPDSGKAPSSDSGVRSDAAAASHDASVVDSASPTEAGSSRDTGAPPTAFVGKTCTKDSQCDPGLTCLAPTSTALGGGGPASGLCTLDCAKGGQAACDSVDPGSICRPLDETGKIAYCFERCIPGAGSDAQKCHLRPDMACAPISNSEAYCAPTCRGDADCEGRKCDPLSGLCVAEVAGTLPVGSACQMPPEGGTLPAAELCKGVCQSTAAAPTKANSACTNPCALGVVGSCDQDPNSTRLPTAGCVPLNLNETNGDVGVCVQLCNCDSDCLNKDFWCAQLAPAAIAQLGQQGTCVTANSVDATQHRASCKATPPDAGTKPTGGGGKGGASSTTDAGESTGGSTAAAPAKNDSGCGCRLGGGGAEPASDSRTSAGALLMVVALLARRARGRGKTAR